MELNNYGIGGKNTDAMMKRKIMYSIPVMIFKIRISIMMKSNDNNHDDIYLVSDHLVLVVLVYFVRCINPLTVNVPLT